MGFRVAVFFILTALPVAVFTILNRRPLLLVSLPVPLIAALWAASPVTYPRWIFHGLIRALPAAAILALALWGLTR